MIALKKRLEEADVIMACTNCHRSWNTAVGRVSVQPRCSRCGAIKIAVVRRFNKQFLPLLTKKHRNAAENKEVRRLHKNASLVLSYGKFAVLALVGRGIGPDTAARILGRYNKLEIRGARNTVFTRYFASRAPICENPWVLGFINIIMVIFIR